MMKGRKDSFEFFLNHDRDKKPQSVLEDPMDWKNVASEGSPVNSQKKKGRESYLDKRASSEDSIGDLDSSENNYNLISFVVKLLLHRQKCTFEELFGSVASAYDTVMATKRGKSKTQLKKKLKECLGQTTLFYCDRDKYWRLADKEAASQYLAGLRDTLSKRSETTVSPRGEKSDEHPADEVARSRPSKRRYQRSLPKYDETIDALESLCQEYGPMLKNPFSGLAARDKQDQLRSLGSAEKILGLLQCYNYFAPVISAGMKRLKNKEHTTTMNNNLIGVTKILFNLAKKVETQSQASQRDNEG